MIFIPITTADIARFAAQADPVLRNLQITHAYHSLSYVMAERTGEEANWCTFATWASKQAGQTIRKEDLARALERFLGEKIAVRLVTQFTAVVQKKGIRLKHGKLVELMVKAVDPKAAFDHSSDAVARGNLKVFAEIGHEFARFIAMCLKDTDYNKENIARFLAGLHPGPPPDGQDYLARAFETYYRTLFEPQSKIRSERLLFANLLIGFHEQTRLQPGINEALEASVITPGAFTQNLLRVYYPDSPWLASAIHFALRTLGGLVGFEGFVTGYLENARRQAHHLSTQALMTIELPRSNRIQLGTDLAGSFPPALQKISNPDLKALLAEIDPTEDSLSESGAQYWGDLVDRLHFIADLFRCFQVTEELFAPPFSPEQTEKILNGKVPGGKL